MGSSADHHVILSEAVMDLIRAHPAPHLSLPCRGRGHLVPYSFPLFLYSFFLASWLYAQTSVSAALTAAMIVKTSPKVLQIMSKPVLPSDEDHSSMSRISSLFLLSPSSQLPCYIEGPSGISWAVLHNRGLWVGSEGSAQDENTAWSGHTQKPRRVVERSWPGNDLATCSIDK